MSNNLFLNRLAVYTRNNEIAYDEVYHRGVNIICGDNSSGKSTITHFIFYVLGGAFNDWVKEAKLCAAVQAEVEMNGATMVLRREINISDLTNKGNASEPIYIFWGNFEESQKASISEWQKFSYNTTDDKKSFSNVFFENLNIPIVKGDNNITFHQILRLLYVDQDSPTSSLFYYEQFDTTLTRETVADLLLGVYSQELYDSKQRQVEATSELEATRKEIKVIKQFVPNELDLFPSHIKTKIDNKEKEIAELEEELIQLKEKDKQVRYTKTSKLDFERLNDEAIKQREIVKKVHSKIQSLQYEIDDSEYFIKTLDSKIKAIKNSTLAREFLGEFPIEYCPECLSDLSKDVVDNHCKLCKEKIDETYGITQARKIEQDLGFQIRESRTLLSLRSRELIEIKSTYEGEKVKLHSLQLQVNSALKDVKAVRDEKIDALYVTKGFAEGEILQFRTMLESAELYQNLVKKRDELSRELELLDAKIKKLTFEQQATKDSVNKAIEKEGLFLLNNDLKRQADFIEAKEFNVDYRNNIAFISDKDARYSASSNFYLKTTARFAIFLASLIIEKMRYPRFILCDNMEDKGIEEKRAQNFQHIVIEEAQKHNKDLYQMIYTTSFIPEDLKNPEYVVGEYYTKDNPSLKNV